jgi:hypothetical protein
LCSGSDVTSQITLAIGTSNEDNLLPESPNDYVTFSHGVAWASMILDIDNDVHELQIDGQVKIVTASDMELHFNDPISTIDWVSGVNSIFFDPNIETIVNTLYNIGDAEGCSQTAYTSSFPWDTCGSFVFPQWTADDIWYISSGCQSCDAFPMIYTTDWTNAAQWKRLGEYSHENHAVSIQFFGVLTQSGACSQRLENPSLCTNPNDG